MRWFAAFSLAAYMGYKGICYAGPIAWASAAIFVIISYFLIIKEFKIPLFGPLNQISALKKEFQIRIEKRKKR